MQRPRLVAFAGSARRGSFNKRLVRIAAAGATDAGAQVEVVDLSDLPMPLYDADLEAAEGLPANARAFKARLIAAHGFLVASPEYNSSITPLLKNAIDWASRKEGDEAPLRAYRGKVAGLMSASPGALCGLRGLGTVRSILGNIGVWVLPHQVAVPKAHEAFADDGSLRDARLDASVRAIGAGVAHAAAALADDSDPS